MPTCCPLSRQGPLFIPLASTTTILAIPWAPLPDPPAHSHHLQVYLLWPSCAPHYKLWWVGRQLLLGDGATAGHQYFTGVSPVFSCTFNQFLLLLSFKRRKQSMDLGAKVPALGAPGSATAVGLGQVLSLLGTCVQSALAQVASAPGSLLLQEVWG